MRILIAEDVPSNQKVLTLILARYGRCDSVDHGEDAVRAAALAIKNGTPYQLLCLDFLMPDINGREVLHRIRAEEEACGLAPEERVRVICLSSVDDPSQLGDLLEDPWTVHIVKPVTSKQLQGVLEQMRLTPDAE